MEAAKELVEDLARRLRGRLSRRYKRRKRGRLDFRRTIRASIAHGGVPLDLLLRGRRPGKPDLVALCDLSGSVAVVSDFLLALLAPAAEYFRQVRTFAYVDRVCEVSFEQGYVVPHTALDLYAWSDFGKVLQQFWHEYGEHLLTHNTLVLVLGDARNNRRPPRPDLLARMRDRARKLVWLNPEPRERWNTGDSVIWPSWQAEPVEAAISGTFCSNSAPMWPTKLTLSVFGNRSSGWPFSAIRSPSAERSRICSLVSFDETCTATSWYVHPSASACSSHASSATEYSERRNVSCDRTTQRILRSSSGANFSSCGCQSASNARRMSSACWRSCQPRHRKSDTRRWYSGPIGTT